MKEIMDGYLCTADTCEKELQDNMPPCSECEFCLSYEEYCEIMRNIQNT